VSIISNKVSDFSNKDKILVSLSEHDIELLITCINWFKDLDSTNSDEYKEREYKTQYSMYLSSERKFNPDDETLDYDQWKVQKEEGSLKVKLRDIALVKKLISYRPALTKTELNLLTSIPLDHDEIWKVESALYFMISNCSIPNIGSVDEFLGKQAKETPQMLNLWHRLYMYRHIASLQETINKLQTRVTELENNQQLSSTDDNSA